MTKQDKKVISEISLAIANDNREEMVDCIKEYAGDEFDTRDDVWKLAKQTNEQLRKNLQNIIEYYLNAE